MTSTQSLTASNMVIVAGKGGVGKTISAAVISIVAARSGLSVLLIDLEDKSDLPALFGRERFGYDTMLVREPGEGDGPIYARTISADHAMLDYLEDHGLQRISKRLVSTGALEVVSTTTPGIEEILVLGKLKQLERSEEYDLIVVDAPAAGHAISFLQAPATVADTARSGPIHAVASSVVEMLNHAKRCQVVLVTLPEQTPINELIETAYSLEDTVGVKLGSIIVNGCHRAPSGLSTDPATAAAEAGVTIDPAVLDEMASAAAFRRERVAMETTEIERLAADLPLPQIRLPYLYQAGLTTADVEALAGALIRLEGAR